MTFDNNSPVGTCSGCWQRVPLELRAGDEGLMPVLHDPYDGRPYRDGSGIEPCLGSLIQTEVIEVAMSMITEADVQFC